jgi:hypothetical protein
MADLAAVHQSIVTLCSGILYPTPPTTPTQLSVAGTAVRIFPGWPLKAQIDKDLAQGICTVSVYPAHMERPSTRYLANYQNLSLNTPTLTLSSSGQTVTVGGTIPPASNPHNLAIFVNRVPYVYATLPNDTLATIAAALAALIPGAVSAGPVIAIPEMSVIGPVRVGITGTSGRPVRNTQRVFQITVWANTPANRDAIAGVLDPVLAATPFVFMPDGTAGKFEYRGSPETDQYEKSTLYKRDLMYSVDYSTMQTVTVPQIVAVEVNLSAAVDGVPPFVPVATEFS